MSHLKYLPILCFSIFFNNLADVYKRQGVERRAGRAHERRGERRHRGRTGEAEARHRLHQAGGTVLYAASRAAAGADLDAAGQREAGELPVGACATHPHGSCLLYTSRCV